MNYSSFNRSLRLEYTGCYIFYPDNVSKEEAHLLEHLVILRLRSLDRAFSSVTGITNTDFIYLSSPDELTTEMFSRLTNLEFYAEFSTDLYDTGVSELEQERTLINNNLQKLMAVVRQGSEHYPISRIKGFRNRIDSSVRRLNLTFISNELESADATRSVQPFGQKPFFFCSGKRRITHDIGNFTCKYIRVSVSSLPNYKTPYFIQLYVNRVNVMLRQLRSLGAYSSFAFALYHKKSVELFFLTTTVSSETLGREVIKKKFLEVIEDSDFSFREVREDPKYYRTRENLAALYQDIRFLESRKSRMIDEENIVFLETLIKSGEVIEILQKEMGK